MSSVRGGGPPRGRGRGAGQTAPRGAPRGSSRGRVFTNNNSTRGNTNAGSPFGQVSRGNMRGAPRGGMGASNGFRPQQQQQQNNGFGGPQPQSQGSWSDRYATLSKLREKERAQAIRMGQIADPDKPRSLADAVTLVGTCQEMCAEFERVQRVVQKDVWAEETDPNAGVVSSVDREPDEARMVKKFRRAAAGLEEQMPSDLRPPQVLKMTCDYLFDDVIGNAEALHTVHHFVWDRTRAIRNDFSIQQVTKPEDLRIAIDCYERIARFHILSLHQLAVQPKPYDKYDPQQEREQLDRTLLSLTQYYDDCHGRVNLPNEAEFRTYSIIFQLQDPTPDLEDRVQCWPREIVANSRVQTALRLYAAACSTIDAQGPLKPHAKPTIAQQDWGHFWTLIRSKKVSYLMACVAETYFSMVRRTTLNTIWRSFKGNPKNPDQDWNVEALCNAFAFDDEAQVYKFFEGFGFSFADRRDGDGQFLDLTSVRDRELPHPSSATMKQVKSMVVEEKRFGRSLPSIINGMSFQQAENAGLVDHEEIAEMMGDAAGDLEMDSMNDGVDDGESLFLPESQPFKPAENKPTQQPLSGFGNAASTNPFKPAAAQSAGGFSFGQPSGANDAPANNNAAPKTTFGSFSENKPANTAGPFSTSSQPSAFNFAQPAARPAAPPTEAPTAAPKLPAFDPAPSAFSGFGNPAAETKKTEEPAAKPFFSFASGEQPKQAAPEAEKKSDATNGFFDWQKKEPTAPAASENKPAPPPGQLSFAQPEPPKQTSAPTMFGQPSTAPVTSTTSGPQAQLPPMPSSPPSPKLDNSHLRRNSLQQTKPKHPSPLAHSFSAEEEETAAPAVPASAPASTPSFEVKPPTKDLFAGKQISQPQPQPPQPKRFEPVKPAPVPQVNPKEVIHRIANEVYETPVYGFYDQFVEFIVQQVVTEVKDKVHLERTTKMADDFRRNVLAHRYLKRWREICWRKRLRLQGEKRRERNQKRLQESRAERAAGITHDPALGSSTATSVFGALVGQQNGHREPRHNESTRGQDMMSPEFVKPQPINRNKRPSSSHGVNASVAARQTGHKRLKSTSHVDPRGRVSKTTPTSAPSNEVLNRSSFLGFSLSGDVGKNSSTTKTNYFRLKALGINQSAPDHNRGTKRRRDDSIGPQSLTSPTASDRHALAIKSPLRRSSESKQLRASTPRNNDDDDALFARLKAARENLKEGAEYFQSEMRKSQEGRPDYLSASIDSNESPSMARARAEARWKASQNPSAASTIGSSVDVPAYRLRESRFVPREKYGKAIERANDMRASRSRETSRPPSQLEHVEAMPSTEVTSFSAFDTPPQKPAPKAADLRPQETISNKPSFSAIPQASPFAPTSEPVFTPFSAAEPFGSGFQPSQDMSHGFQTQMTPSPFAPTSFGQPAFGTSPDNAQHDFTIQPSQVGKSLASSFGPSTGNGQSTDFGGFGQGPIDLEPSPLPQSIPQQQTNDMFTPAFSQPTSYVNSQAVSLLSDDEDEVPKGYVNQQAMNNGAQSAGGSNGVEISEHSEDDNVGASFGHANPYAALGEQGETEESEEDEEIDEDEELWDEGEGGGVYDRTPTRHTYNNVNEEDDDGDVEDDEEIYDEDDDLSEDEEDEEEYDEDEPPYVNQHYNRPPPPNEALQGVGGTEEEAIELSD